MHLFKVIAKSRKTDQFKLHDLQKNVHLIPVDDYPHVRVHDVLIGIEGNAKLKLLTDDDELVTRKWINHV